MAQLNACGVVETIRISAAGYPIRWEKRTEPSKRFLIETTCALSLKFHDNDRHFSFRLSHHEFLQRYRLALKHLNPVTRSHVTLPQARSPKNAEASPRVPAVERLKRRSRRRHRSSYDHKRHICRSILEVVQVDSDDGKENLHTNDSDGVKIGQTKVFLREDTVRWPDCIGAYGPRWRQRSPCRIWTVKTTVKSRVKLLNQQCLR